MSRSSLLFDKKLSKTDVEHRLSFSSSVQREYLRIEEGQNCIDFLAKYGDDETERKFRCKIRNKVNEKYNKPVISKGWRQIVKEKGLKEGDKLLFYKVEADQSVNFKFVVERKIMTLFGKEIWDPVR
ncbi:B3 domain-containing protein [Quillaja saponaria]|uniref:B3 domain-containing protein n=1 Tax=Quillaja saponaria TaxID=32244 RepID=A0AAD7M174_QUISA|nr:B3 domain-containing protein [Quillaja saponaria]